MKQFAEGAEAGEVIKAAEKRLFGLYHINMLRLRDVEV